MQVSISIKGDKQVQHKLRKLGLALYDFSGAMRIIGKEAGNYFANEAFNSQGGVFGSVWPRLSPRTVAAKLRLYPQFANMPLVASGKMKNSFIASTGSQSVTISNTAPHYKYHQSTAARSKLPRRQMAGVNDPVKQIVRRVLEADIKRKISNA